MAVKTPELAYPKHVSEDADLVARALGVASRVFLFLDYGGTLVARGRDGADPPSELSRYLGNLCDSSSLTVFVVSDRSAREIRQLLDVRGLNIIAQGGLEIERWGEDPVYPVDPGRSGSLLHRLELELHRHLRNLADLRIENRGFSVTLAGAPGAGGPSSEAVDRFAGLVKSLDTGRVLELRYGEDDVEARIAGWNKGDAVKHVLREADPEECLAVYVGDDVTDEEGFLAVKEWSSGSESELGRSWYSAGEDDDEESTNAITVLVAPSPRPTTASLFVRGPEEVHELVSSLAAVATALL